MPTEGRARVEKPYSSLITGLTKNQKNQESVKYSKRSIGGNNA